MDFQKVYLRSIFFFQGFKFSNQSWILFRFGYGKGKQICTLTSSQFADLTFFRMVQKFETFREIFVWNQVFRRFAKWNLTTLNFTLFLNKQCYIQIYDDLEESEFDETDEEWEEEEEEKETTLEKTTSNLFLILGECWKGLSPPISETEIVGKWYGCIFKAKKKTYFYKGRATRRFLSDEGGLITALEID